MKLNIGDNIRSYRRAINMTQEELAKQLDVSYQSVSRWENGSCYPDMELLPALARIFSVTVDALLNCPDDGKWKRFDELIAKFETAVNEPDKNAETIVSLMREARRDYPEYINIGPICHFQQFFMETEFRRLYENPVIRDEISVLAYFITEHSSNTFLKSFVIKSMTKIISDENLDAYLNKNATNDDLSKSTLLRERYQYRLNWVKLAESRQDDLYFLIQNICTNEDLWFDKSETLDANYCLWANKICVKLLNAVRNITPDPLHPVSGNGEVDLWATDIIKLGMRQAGFRAGTGDREGAFLVLEDVITLMEKSEALPDGTVLNASSPALNKVEDKAYHSWSDCSNQDEPNILIISLKYRQVQSMFLTHNDFISPNPFRDWFSPIRDDPRYSDYVRRVKALRQTRKKQQ